jgi:flagellar hook protein FlgE
MSFALSAGVDGLQDHRRMLDSADNSQVNANTTALKSSGTTFSAQLREKTQKASQSTGTVDCYCYELQFRQQNQSAANSFKPKQRSMAELAVNLGGGS